MMESFSDIGMLNAAAHALQSILQIDRIMFLWFGVLVGLAIGLLPGIGGLTGFALLVPFTFTMDPVSAFAMLLGMASVTTTSDTIPAVLLGVPGTASSQATVLDGLPMTQKGEAGRALSAGFTASLIGGLIGALIMGVSIPIVRPFVLMISTPELLAMTIFGIAMVSTLSGNAPLRGVIAGCMGILISMVGTNVQTGQLRWTGDLIYLADGIPMLPVLLGIFALPELCDLAIGRRALAKRIKFSPTHGMIQGVKDVFQNFFLVVRCSGLGALLGAIPGITGSVTDWIAYGHAVSTVKGADKTFSKGDVRGVIAPESANNAKEGGSLVPMIAFGVPGGAAQAILLGALMVHGFIPGPEMLTKHLDMTYSMVWSIALANVFGAGMCFLLSGQFAKISTLRYTLILPSILAIVFVGAFQGSRSWGDLVVLLLFGILGWTMKRLKWPRPPLILGLVLGVLLERYMAISVLRYDFDWLTRPGVVVLLLLSLWAIVRPLLKRIRHEGLISTFRLGGTPILKLEDLFYVFFMVIAGVMVITAQDWFFNARIGPTVIGITLLIAASISLIYLVFAERSNAVDSAELSHRGIHMDLESSKEDALPAKTVVYRAGIFFAWFVAFLLSMGTIGLIPSVPLMIIAFMRLEGRESWKLCFLLASSVTVLIYIVFDLILHVPWPHTLMGHFFPALSAIIPSM